MIAFYYALSGAACVIYYRRELTKSVRNFLFIGVAPAVGALILGYLLVRSVIDLSDPEASYSGSAVLGVGVPLVIGVAFLALGAVIMVGWWAAGHRSYFGRRPFEALPHDFVPGAAAEELAEVPAGEALMAAGVVLGFDDSEGSRGALEAAIEVAPASSASRCTSPSPRRRRPWWGRSRPSTAARWRRSAAGCSSEAVAAARAAGVQVEAHLAPERPVDLLLRLADEHDARMIVVGTYGEHPLRGAILGATPHKLLHLSTRPVLAVPAG